MQAASWPRAGIQAQKLLVIASLEPESRKLSELPELLAPGDVLVLNDAATFPASLQAQTTRGEPIELRLLPPVTVASSQKGPAEAWDAVTLGAGNWTQRTEDRPQPPRLKTGDLLRIGKRLEARVIRVSPDSFRRLTVKFNLTGGDLWREIYRVGKPVQYSYLRTELALWSVQTSYAARPWASELPSAGRPLSWDLLLRLKRKGVRIVSLTHSTGLSSTGDSELDSKLPFPERFQIPERTVAEIEGAKRRQSRVIAVGTSVVRALEGQAAKNSGRLIAGTGSTDLVIRSAFQRQTVDGILTGIHEIGESHFKQLESFVEREILESALAIAEREDYLTHEFGDSCLILPR